MSKIVHPFAHRLGIIRDWKSRWFGARGKYQEFLRGDVLIREYLNKRMRGFYVAGVDIERSEKKLRIILKSSRPGMIIGRSGEGQVKLRQDLLKEMKRQKIKIPEEFKIDIQEVHSPEANAAIVAYMAAEALEKRLPFRRVLKQMTEKVMASREVKGVKIALSGRLGGADMARREEIKKGGIPLQTFRADIDFAREKAHLPYGDVGIKVWIYKGLIFNEKNEKNK
ncbi:MAG: 30S ribosomal protein S3 [Candidatus Lloydbacteria bacterium RIFCSPHIGHO2_01_FULL_41_20]|uniref:Small ribosomal subunit protein uS3 n=1 Tax=Candidatus Lloydbacteria bacterium RIFCSPHIGHO2_01_FULL_41_20 TaxID=1798657 RepID=A0A1G2CTP1_9BACT|nr:MAG: 30S ribosomal protein S3 [Candidatus Lloydbacteria bacterium RIFCSPHIGHO2_01_FULL_41_20]